jgi:cyclopropane-fatty-acyl-phospholipid synthase
MLEHLGRRHYHQYFTKINDLLVEDGAALICPIGRRGPPEPINLWLQRRMFPDAYRPSLSQLAAAIERAGLWVLDCENPRIHYAKTLNRWHAALRAHKSNIETIQKRAILSSLGILPDFLRAWLPTSRPDRIQLLLSKKPDAVPLTRNFIYEEEMRLQKPVTGHRTFLREVGRNDLLE